MATINIKNVSDILYARLKARAKQQRRSVAQEVTFILEQALEEAAPPSLLELRGLGRELWVGIDAAEHVDAERESWD